MSLEIVGNTINGLRGGGIETSVEVFTSAPSGWTVTGDTGDVTYSSAGAKITSGSGWGVTNDPTVTFTLNKRKVNNFASITFGGLTPSGGGSDALRCKIGLDGEMKDLQLVSAAVDRGGGISLIRTGQTWTYIMRGGLDNGGDLGANSTGTFTTTGPGKELSIVLNVNGGVAYSVGGHNTLRGVMYS